MNEKRQNPDSFKHFERLIQVEKARFTDDRVLSLCDDLGDFLSDKTQDNTTTQVRKFYNLARLAKEQSKEKPADFIKIKLRTLQAQITYAAARKTISPDFRTIVNNSITKIINSKEIHQEFGDFMTFFESLFAHFYYHAEQKKNNKERQGGRRR